MQVGQLANDSNLGVQALHCELVIEMEDSVMGVPVILVAKLLNHQGMFQLSQPAVSSLLRLTLYNLLLSLTFPSLFLKFKL